MIISKRTGGDKFSTALFGMLLVLIAVSPLHLGSNRWWSSALMEMGFMALLMLTSLNVALSRHERQKVPRSIFIPAFLYGCWIVYTLIQTLHLPSVVVSILNPTGAEIAANPLSGSHSMGMGIDATGAIERLLQGSAYLAALMSSLLLVNTALRVRIVLIVFVFCGAVQVLLALWFLSSGDVFSWLPSSERLDGIRGTFANRNHFAMAVLLGVAATLGLMLDQQLKAGNQSGGNRIRNILDYLLGPQILFLVILCILGSGLVLSQSRGPVLAGMVVLVIVSIAGFFRKQARTNSPFLFKLLAVLILAALMSSGFESLLQRFNPEIVTNDERLIQWAVSLQVLRDFWLFGAGPGSYEEIFSLYREGTLRPLTYKHAHNDYIELWVEQGIVGMSLLGSALIYCLVRFTRSYLLRRNRLVRAGILTSLIGCGGMLLASFVDFHFQIPSNGLWFHVLLGMGLSLTCYSNRHRYRSVTEAA